jgi:L-fuconolactonase
MTMPTRCRPPTASRRTTLGTIGVRTMLAKEAKREPDDLGLDRILRAVAKHDFRVHVLFWSNMDASTALIDPHPDARFIIDQLALLQPSVRPRRRSPGQRSKPQPYQPQGLV